MGANDNEPPVGVVELSPDASALLRRQYELDRQEAGSRLPVDSLEYRGITLESRFSVVQEFDDMKAVVDALPDLTRIRVASMWCDSRACSDYIVRIISGRWIEGIEWEIRDAFLSTTDGFNGLHIQGDAREASFDPVWLGDIEQDDCGVHNDRN